MRKLSLLCVLLVAGCAPPSPQLNTGGAPPRVEPVAGGYEVQLSDNSGPVVASLPASPDQVWPALMQVFQELGIPVTTIDPGNRVLGNQKHEVRRRLAGTQLSTYLDCGQNLSGTIADNYRVHLMVISQVQAAAGGSTLQTKVSGSARSNEGASGNLVACGSTGRLEARIANAVKLKTAG